MQVTRRLGNVVSGRIVALPRGHACQQLRAIRTSFASAASRWICDRAS